MNAAILADTAALTEIAARSLADTDRYAVTVTFTADPAKGWRAHNAAAALVRFPTTSRTVDLTGTPIASALADIAGEHTSLGAIEPLTLRLRPELPHTGIELDPRAAMYLLGVHARAAAHRPGTSPDDFTVLDDFGFDAVDAAQHSTDFEPQNIRTKGANLYALYERRALTSHLPAARVHTPESLRFAAQLLIRTSAAALHANDPSRRRPARVTFSAGHFDGRPQWNTITGVTVTYTDGHTRNDISYPSTALRAILHALATIETPATGETLTLDATDSPLSSNPIPADGSVYNDMPGGPLTLAQVANAVRGLHDAYPNHDDYAMQQYSRSHGWALPNHDNPPVFTRGEVAGALLRIRDANPNTVTARFSITKTGTVYASNGRTAVRFIPTALIPGYTPEHCPGCGTPTAHNGDGPCGY
jgi:hypothetical protein